MQTLGYIINTFFIALMIGVVGLFMVPYLPFDHGIEMRIVESGSMEPAIMTGSLILVQPAESYVPGDVIMFESRFGDVPTTHRVVETYEERGSTWFVTKGDANEEADANVVPMREVMGKVAIDIPRAGFVLDFARQPMGFIFLIVLPACLIVLTELEKIWREIRGRQRMDSDDNDGDDTGTTQPDARMKQVATRSYQPMMDIGTPVRYMLWPTLDLRSMTPYQRRKTPRVSFSRTAAVSSIVGFSLLVVSANFLGSTVSYFNDTEESSGNAFAAVTLDFMANADGSAYTFFAGALTDEDGGVEISVTPEPESVDMLHEVAVEVTGGSGVLCDAVIADTNAPFVYTGAFPLMSASNVAFSTPWTVDFSLGDTDGLSGGERCMADIVLTAWHFDVTTGDGYFDEERVPLTFDYTLPEPAFAPSVAGASFNPGPESQSIEKDGQGNSEGKTEHGGEQKASGDSAPVREVNGNANGSAEGQENREEGQEEVAAQNAQVGGNNADESRNNKEDEEENVTPPAEEEDEEVSDEEGEQTEEEEAAEETEEENSEEEEVGNEQEESADEENSEDIEEEDETGETGSEQSEGDAGATE